MSLIKGDSHNFGSTVQQINTDSGTFYLKPRTMFWELLFFGNDSPLKKIFEHSCINNLFSLEVETFDGKILQKEIKHNDNYPFSFHKFGYLIGYCFVFGIQDLHHNNCIRTNDCFQPIDVEVVLSRLISPSQTCLLPGINIRFEKSALSMISTKLQPNEAESLLTGFIDVLNFIYSKKHEIQNIFHSINEIKTEPIRIIFKDTENYRASDQFFTAEENQQLLHGDIPFFFKFYNSNHVWYFQQSNKAKKIENLLPYYRKKSKIVGLNIEELISEEEFNSRIFPLGILNLANSLYPYLQLKEFNHLNYNLIFSDKKINLNWNKKSFNLNL